MAYLKFKGLEEYLSRLGNLEFVSEKMLGDAAKKGGGVVADAIRSEIDSLPTTEEWGTNSEPKHGIRAIQKAGLSHGFGVAPVQNDNGYINVKVGFDGYNKLRSAQWPNGQPNVLIARSVEKGTSFMRSNKFVSRGVRKSKDRADKTMELYIDSEITKIMN